LAKSIQRAESIARAYHNLGICYSFKESWQEALDAYEHSLEVSERIGLLETAGKSYVQKGHVYLCLKDVTLAATYCAKALDIADEIGRPLGRANAFRVLGRLIGERGDYITGMNVLEQGLEIFRQFENPLGEAEIMREIGTLQLNRDTSDRGNQTLQNALSIFERIGARGEVARTRSLLAN
jgi:tetratricopeptide (TPR) repeat protein